MKDTAVNNIKTGLRDVDKRTGAPVSRVADISPRKACVMCGAKIAPGSKWCVSCARERFSTILPTPAYESEALPAPTPAQIRRAIAKRVRLPDTRGIPPEDIDPKRARFVDEVVAKLRGAQ